MSDVGVQIVSIVVFLVAFGLGFLQGFFRGQIGAQREHLKYLRESSKRADDEMQWLRAALVDKEPSK